MMSVVAAVTMLVLLMNMRMRVSVLTLIRVIQMVVVMFPVVV